MFLRLWTSGEPATGLSFAAVDDGRAGRRVRVLLTTDMVGYGQKGLAGHAFTRILPPPGHARRLGSQPWGVGQAWDSRYWSTMALRARCPFRASVRSTSCILRG